MREAAASRAATGNQAEQAQEPTSPPGPADGVAACVEAQTLLARWLHAGARRRRLGPGAAQAYRRFYGLRRDDAGDT